MPKRCAPPAPPPACASRIDLANEKINYKVREHSLAKIPALLVVGRREAENKTVALRRLGAKDQEILALGEAVARLKAEAVRRRRRPGHCRNKLRSSRIPPVQLKRRRRPAMTARASTMKSTSPRVRLVDERRRNGRGRVPRNDALARAMEAGLDLVEVSPNADPPVCKILDFGKFKYEDPEKEERGAQESRRSSRSRRSSSAPTSTTRLRRQDAHDATVPRGGDKVKVTHALPRPRDGAPGSRHERADAREGRARRVAKVEQLPAAWKAAR